VCQTAVHWNLTSAVTWNADGGHIYKLEIPYAFKSYNKNRLDRMYGEMELCLRLNRVKICT
jgi:hypothetical protein